MNTGLLEKAQRYDAIMTQVRKLGYQTATAALIGLTGRVALLEHAIRSAVAAASECPFCSARLALGDSHRPDCFFLSGFSTPSEPQITPGTDTPSADQVDPPPERAGQCHVYRAPGTMAPWCEVCGLKEDHAIHKVKRYPPPGASLNPRADSPAARLARLERVVWAMLWESSSKAYNAVDRADIDWLYTEGGRV